MIDNAIFHLHSPNGVAAFRDALALEATTTLERALADLDGFRDSYLGPPYCPASFTRLEIEVFLEDRARHERAVHRSMRE